MPQNIASVESQSTYSPVNCTGAASGIFFGVLLHAAVTAITNGTRDFTPPRLLLGERVGKRQLGERVLELDPGEHDLLLGVDDRDRLFLHALGDVLHLLLEVRHQVAAG